jgi:hypothetical protein
MKDVSNGLDSVHIYIYILFCVCECVYGPPVQKEFQRHSRLTCWLVATKQRVSSFLRETYSNECEMTAVYCVCVFFWLTESNNGGEQVRSCLLTSSPATTF